MGQCKYEFCWMCMGDWAEHGATTGGFYKCNRFDPSKDNEDDQSDTAKAKRELDRYLHYYKRYHGHDQAQKFATKQLEATEKRMMELQETTSGSWIDVQFLKAANEMVIDCRRVLKYTYVFGYYLDPKKNKMKELFENLQEHLEKFTEQLSEDGAAGGPDGPHGDRQRHARDRVLPREPHQGHGERPRRAGGAAARAGIGQVIAVPPA